MENISIQGKFDIFSVFGIILLEKLQIIKIIFIVKYKTFRNYFKLSVTMLIIFMRKHHIKKIHS